MNRDNRHPNDELLDRLRAGLLDDSPEQQHDLETHIAHCPRCRQRYDLPHALAAVAIREPALRLDAARRQALQAPRRSAMRRLAPLAAAAAAAVVAVLLVQPLQQHEEPDTRVAQRETREIPELYEDLDFYLWLADHKQDKDSRS
jgi:ferric-dicitrate binding protein FerR (iron transport regulator)